MKVQIFVIWFSLFSFPFLSVGQTLVIRHANVVQTDAGTVAEDQYILIEDGVIQQTGKDKKWKNKQEIEEWDAKGQFVMPGLIDGHVHYFQSGGLYARPDAIDLQALRPYEEEVQWIKDQAPDLWRRYLAAGITQTCDVGGPMTNFELREQATKTVAPELFVTGPLISSYQPEAFQIDDPPIILCESPEEARELVRKQVPLKPDFIKIWYIVFRNQSPEEHYDMIQAAIEESHKHGIPVAVHATQLETARLAVKAGCDMLVHSVDDQAVDDAFVQLLLENEVSYIPTLMVSRQYSEVFSQNLDISDIDLELANPFTLGSLLDLKHIGPDHLPDYIKMTIGRELGEDTELALMQQNLKKLYEAGVNIVTGTDAGNIGTLHASSYFEELEKMQGAGLSPAEILKASTFNGGKMLKRQIGLIAAGYEASLLLLAQNPLEDLAHLRSLNHLLHKGQKIDADSLLPQTPEILAQRQLNAYNLRRLDAFVDCYHPEVKIYNYPGQLQSTGKEAMREGYGPMFENTPNLHCELVNRIVIGKQVVDKEKITGFAPGQYFFAAAIYIIENGLITEVRFMR